MRNENKGGISRRAHLNFSLEGTLPVFSILSSNSSPTASFKFFEWCKKRPLAAAGG
jgi:hypothetical protein